MRTTALMPVEEYLRLTHKPTCEYREGLLYPKPMPTKFHGVLEFMLVAMLRKLGLDAVAEVTVRLSDTKYLVPDVIAATVIHNPYPTEPVLLCCEILSPEDRIGAMLGKCEEYHAWGVPFCWVIDPVKRTAWEYHAAAEPVRVTATLRAGEFPVNLDELFAALDAADQTPSL
ncbi:MAG: Uma2 family endonuclease [Bryobacteraceae bacterium]